jgi:hypothetical protein
VDTNIVDQTAKIVVLGAIMTTDAEWPRAIVGNRDSHILVRNDAAV